MVGYSWTDDKGKGEKKGCGLGALLMMVVPIAAALAVSFLATTPNDPEPSTVDVQVGDSVWTLEAGNDAAEEVIEAMNQSRG